MQPRVQIATFTQHIQSIGETPSPVPLHLLGDLPFGKEMQ